MEKASYSKIRSEIKDLLNKPVNEKMFKYTSLDMIILILITLDLIMDKLEEVTNNGEIK